MQKKKKSIFSKVHTRIAPWTINRRKVTNKSRRTADQQRWRFSDIVPKPNATFEDHECLFYTCVHFHVCSIYRYAWPLIESKQTSDKRDRGASFIFAKQCHNTSDRGHGATWRRQAFEWLRQISRRAKQLETLAETLDRTSLRNFHTTWPPYSREVGWCGKDRHCEVFARLLQNHECFWMEIIGFF